MKQSTRERGATSKDVSNLQGRSEEREKKKKTTVYIVKRLIDVYKNVERENGGCCCFYNGFKDGDINHKAFSLIDLYQRRPCAA